MEILIKNDDDIRKAHERYQQFTHNDELRAQYRSRERWRRDRASEIGSAKQEGKQEEKDSTAQNMIAEGFKDDVIIRCTGIDPRRLKELRKNQ